MAGSFTIKKSTESDFYFEFSDGAGGLLMISQEFQDRDELEKAIKGVRVGSMMSQFIAVGKDDNDKNYFVIKDETGTVLARSVAFESEMVFNNALHTVRDNACIAAVEDLGNV